MHITNIKKLSNIQIKEKIVSPDLDWNYVRCTLAEPGTLTALFSLNFNTRKRGENENYRIFHVNNKNYYVPFWLYVVENSMSSKL